MIETGIGNIIPKIVVVALVALAGCSDRTGGSTEAEFPGDEMIVETIETDVIAPEAFSITDKGLWDGRPTFGGVWIAYPNIETPERVRITNPSNDQTVIAALYRRERDFAGPQIEMSADAAAALGVVAGTPAELNIVALRRVEVEVEVARNSVPQPMTVPLQRPSTVVLPTIAEVAVPAVEVAASVPTLPDTTPTQAIEATTLPPAQVISEAVAEALSEPEPLPAAPENPSGSYVQVTTLNDATLANELIIKLQTAGLPAEIREAHVGETTLYRIIAGPAASAEALEIMLSTVGQLGYKDAIPLR